MASGDLFTFVQPLGMTSTFSGTQGRAPTMVYSGEINGLSLPKKDDSAYAFEARVWNNGAPLATGITLQIGLVGSPGPGDQFPGTNVRIGVLVKTLPAGGTQDLSEADGAVGTEVFGVYTLPATPGLVGELAIAVPKASIGGAPAAGSRLLIQIRRNGSSALDTCQGRVVLTGVGVLDT